MTPEQKKRVRFSAMLVGLALVVGMVCAGHALADDDDDNDDTPQQQLEQPSGDQNNLENGDQNQRDLEDNQPGQNVEAPSRGQQGLEQGDQRQWDLEH